MLECGGTGMWSRSFAATTSSNSWRASSDEGVRVGVAIREVCEHQSSSARACGESPSLSGGEVAAPRRQVLLGRQERGLAHQQVDPVGQLERAVAPRGVHHEGERLTGPQLADVVESHRAPVDLDAAGGLQASDVGAGDPEGRESIREHVPAGGFLHSPPEGVDAVFEAGASQDQSVVGVSDPGPGGGTTVDRNLLLARRGEAQPIEVLLTAGRVVDRHGDPTLIECPAHEHSGQAEAMIAVEVRDADPRDRCGGDVREHELALRALARVEQHTFTVPAQEVPVVVALSCRRLAGRPQHDELALRHVSAADHHRDRPEVARVGLQTCAATHQQHHGVAR